ncbi:MAG: fibronectin type III domain-containing protein, partial [Bacteroidota bacterium]
TGFTSDYAFVNTPYSGGYSSGTGLWPEGKYAVGPDPNFYHPLFFGSGYPSGTGNLMIVNGSVTPGTKVWGEVVSVTPNTDYYFSAQISTLVPQSPAQLNFSINGLPIGPTLVAPATINNWIQFYAVWNSGANTAANIKIINGNTIASGNDFGLDNISFTTVCSVTDTVVVHVSHIHTEISSANVHCPNGNDGSANLTVTGGIIPYTYSWSNGETTEDISNLAAGTYTVTVYDAAQCSGLNYVVITQPASIVITHTVTDASCNNANGGIDVTVTGGTAPYSYDWVNGATTQDLTGIASGDYTLIVTDANGCTATSTIYVSGTPAISLSETHSNATCGQENANVFLTVTGGTAPFEFLWSNGATDQNLAGVASGTYLVTVTDINGCPAVLQVDVDCTPPLCNMQLTYDHSNNECFGECDGTIDLTVIGGTMPFSYNWSNGGSGIHLINLCAGDYSVTVTDVNGCFAVANINITQHDPIVIVMDTSNSNCEHLCHCCTGAIIAFPSGGVGPYNYVWSNTATGSIAAGLCPGQYFVTVTDASGCTAIGGGYVDCISIPPPPPPSCQAPTNFTVTNVTSSSAILHWDAVPGAYGYKIRRRAVGTTTWVNSGVYAPAHQKTIQNLQCNSAYEWQIETLCNAEQTDVSAWVTNTPNFTTAPYCAMPTGLSVTNITSTSVIVHWITVPNATSYRIRYKKHGTTTWTNTFASATATQKTILNLTPGVTYDWQLRAKCAGSGDVSAFSNSTIQHFTMLNGAREEDENGNASVPMSIFPNPTQSDLTVTLNNGCNCNDGATITITNLLGQTVYSTVAKLNNGQLTQEIMLPASIIDGMYFITVRSNNYVETRKLTVGNK